MTTAQTSPRKVVLVTGASGELGTALCRALLGAYDVVAVRHRRLLRVPSQLQSFFDPLAEDEDGDSADGRRRVFEIEADLLESSQVRRVVEVALARFGGVDVVVNAVGASDSGIGLLAGGLAQGEELFRLNALVPITVAVEVALGCWCQHDRENAERNRVLVNLSSTTSVGGTDSRSGGVFAATKAAENLLSLQLADELWPFKVRVVTVASAPVPDAVTPERVVSAVVDQIEGTETGRIVLLWEDRDEVV